MKKLESKSLADVNLLIKQHSQKISELETENADIKVQLQKAREEINARSRNGAELTQAAEKLAIAESELNRLRGQISTSENKIRSLSRDVESLSADKSKLTQDVSALQNKLDKINAKNQAALEGLLAEHAAKIDHIQADHEEEIEAAYQNSKNCTKVGMSLDKIALKNITIQLHEHAAQTTISLPLLREVNQFIVEMQKSAKNRTPITLTANSELFEAVSKFSKSIKEHRCPNFQKDECRLLADNVGKALVLIMAIYEKLKEVAELKIEQELQNCGYDLNDPRQLDAFEMSNPDAGSLIKFMKRARNFFEPVKRDRIDVLHFVESSSLSQYMDIGDDSNEFGQLSAARMYLKNILVSPKSSNTKTTQPRKDTNPYKYKYLTNEVILTNLSSMIDDDYSGFVKEYGTGDVEGDKYIRDVVMQINDEDAKHPCLPEPLAGELIIMQSLLDHLSKKGIKNDSRMAAKQDLLWRWPQVLKMIQPMVQPADDSKSIKQQRSTNAWNGKEQPKLKDVLR